MAQLMKSTSIIISVFVLVFVFVFVIVFVSIFEFWLIRIFCNSTL